MSAVSEIPQGMRPPNAQDVQRIIRHNYAQWAKRFLVRICIFGALCVMPAILRAMGTPNAFWVVTPAIPGILGLVITGYRYLFTLSALGKCRRVLDHYPLEFRKGVRPKGKRNTRFGTVHFVRISDHEPDRAPIMRAEDVQGRDDWPDDLKDGVWLAGDLPFGGVIVGAAGDTVMPVRPRDWNEFAQEREQAGPERIARAKQARLLRKAG